jgi:NADH-quinone oxidoreductase subunit E
MDGLKRRLARAIQTQTQETVTILSSLLAVEDELGYVPKQAIKEVAAFTRSTINDVWAVASFYPNFRFEPPCKNTVEICWGPSCHLAGAMSVIGEALEVAGLEGEGDTSDKRLTIRYNTCLGACAQAPVVTINQQLVGRLKPNETRAHIIKLLADPDLDIDHGN